VNRADRQRGSTLLLFPAAVLVMIVLSAIAIDFSIAFLGEREIAGATAAAANDTAARALSNPAFYSDGVVALDETVARQIATASLRRSLDARRYRGLRVTVTVPSGGRTVVVSASAEVDYVFAHAIPGASHRVRVESTSTATLEQP
jgi:Flp pilus assembly protein TadG